MEKDKRVHNWVVGEDVPVLTTSIGTVRSGPAVCRRNGKCKNLYSFDFPHWVNVVAVTPERKIVLIRQFRYGTRQIEVELPGGMVDPGEKPLQAGCRELVEETGYVGEHAEIIGKVCPNPALQNNFCYTILVHNAVQKQAVQFGEMEDIECYLTSEEKVFEAVGEGAIRHGLVLNGLMFYWMYTTGGELPRTCISPQDSALKR